jgi:hypothetical protein
MVDGNGEFLCAGILGKGLRQNGTILGVDEFWIDA